MAPSRKRPRTDPPSRNQNNCLKLVQCTAESTQSVIAGSSPQLQNTPSDEIDSRTNEDDPTSLENILADANSSNELKSKSSWFGTWPRKSKPSTQVAKETILADKLANGLSAADLSRFEPKKPSSAIPAKTAGRPPSMYLGKSKETLDLTMGGTLESGDSVKANSTMNQTAPARNDKMLETKAQDEKPATVDRPKSDIAEQRPNTSPSWLGLFGKSAALAANTTDKQVGLIQSVERAPAKDAQASISNQESAVASNDEGSKPSASSSNSTSWFGLWSIAPPSINHEAPDAQMPLKVIESNADTIMEDPPPSKVVQPVAGSSWAFWSTDNDQKAIEASSKGQEFGKLAVAGELSQHSPESARTVKITDVANTDKKTKPSKKGRPETIEVNERTTQASPSGPESSKPSASQHISKDLPANLLIPSIKSTYRLVENPSILQQIARLLLQGHQEPVKHVFLSKDTPKIKKALAIGIHGLFPAPVLRTVIGQPTGTSIKFAYHAADAIRRWTDAHGCASCEIEKVALEGEGRIAERVDNLWKLLLNWIDHVRKADFILVACHSQGVPVAVMLVAKLIEFGVLSNGKIGICAMAGVSLGPFPDYKSRLFSGSAGELFDFAHPDSVVSKKYEDSLRVAVKYGVRTTYCGSIDDQLVSMESSIFSPISHPYIFRAVFIDGRIHAPDFLSHLVGFALKLRNLGVSDHGLIRELSAPLAGSLYTGEGHSRLYDDGKVYDLAVEYALETTSVGDVPLQIQKYEIPTNGNPYHLPWIMRGLLEENFVKTELDTETNDLLKEFDDWKPTTKVLKDVKYRLEAVRSKL